MENSMPLSIALENARAMVISAFNQVQEEIKLPSYLMEGIVLDLLSQIRNQKNVELVADMNQMKAARENKEMQNDEKEGDE